MALVSALLIAWKVRVVRATPDSHSGLNQGERRSISEVYVQVGAGEAI